MQSDISLSECRQSAKMFDRAPLPLFSHAEKTWLDQMLDDHLLVRDLVLVAFFLVPYSVTSKLWYELTWQQAFGSGILFAVLVLAIAEVYAQWRGTSMFRFFGGDPLS